MINRCFRTKDKRYKDYGGRGITVCNEWRNSFKAFYAWAIANGYTDELTIDRIDNNGNYEPSNCRWLSLKEQANNRRSNHLVTYDGQTKTITQWSEERNIKKSTLQRRLSKNGWSVKRALEF